MHASRTAGPNRITLRREASIDCRTERRSDSRLPPSLSRVTPSAVSEHFSELLGRPISRSLTASCVGLELRLLPSPGITRLPRYYEPPRHPIRPGLSLTRFRLIPYRNHRWGFPCCVWSPLHACHRQYPGRTEMVDSLVVPSQRRPSLVSRRVGSCVTLFEACS